MPVRRPRPPAASLGFSLVEVLVVIAIIAVLIALLLPAVQKVREAAARSRCQNNLKQIGVACHLYMDVNAGRLPAGGLNLAPDSTATVRDKGSWMFHILPYMEASQVYDRAPDLPNPNVDSVSNSAPVGTAKLPWMACPADRFRGQINLTTTFANSNYAGSGGPMCGRSYGCPSPTCVPAITACTDPFSPAYCNRPDLGYGSSDISARSTNLGRLRGMFARPDRVFPSLQQAIRIGPPDVTDGMSNTLMIGETLPNENRYSVDGPSVRGSPQGMVLTTIIPLNTRTPIPRTGNSADCNTHGTQIFGNWGFSAGFKAEHPGGVNFLFGDGSVRFLSQRMNMDTLQLLGCRNDGRPIDASQY